MEIYTGYYGCAERYEKAGYALVQMSCRVPYLCGKISYKAEILMPSECDCFKFNQGIITEEEFRKNSLAKLEARKNEVLRTIKEITNKCESNNFKGFVMLCYDSGSGQYYNSIVNRFCNEQLGIDMQELIM